MFLVASRLFSSSSAFPETDWLSGEAASQSNACGALTPRACATAADTTRTTLTRRKAGRM